MNHRSSYHWAFASVAVLIAAAWCSLGPLTFHPESLVVHENE